MNLEMILNVINTICQIILTIAAIIAIVITIKQIQNKSKSKLKVSYKCGIGLSLIENEYKKITGITITLTNNGLGPVYYDDCGFIFVNDKKYLSGKTYPGIIANRSVEEEHKKLMPGESRIESIYYPEILLKPQKISSSDKVYIYVDLCNGTQFAWNTGDTYKQFLSKYKQVLKRKDENEL